ncbi:tetratricopeptide repeat protein [Neisseria sp. 83E34]|uniref:tetratricopeptide repeat protein n=1 Tax=Neisseria sp. 83E34 TaxID=1692264 RepID=UPI0006CEA77A|nr:tetratricopeptide repeat protein [Neisseria sp. 83E34]KPN72366.1 hypothetical protein AKG09_00455 [Neisseria sp. 83E34]
MPFFQKRFQPLVLSLLLSAALPAFASSEVPRASDYELIESAAKKAKKEEPQISEYERRARLVKRSSELFTLLGGEIALQKGDVATALASYMVAFNRIKDSKVGERAMEMAISLHAYEQAETIYQRWREVEPEPSEAQQRMAWVRSLTLKEFNAVEKNFDKVMEKADSESKRKLFLQLAQAAIEHPEFAKRVDRKVKRATKPYPDMPEAVITQAIFSSLANDEQGAIQALQRLTELDTQIVPATMFTLRLIGQQNPEILNKFFAEAKTNKLSPVWRELQVEGLIYSGKYSEAYDLLQELLKEKPDADLYMQAALLAITQKAELPVILSYLEQVYNIGTQEQRSRAAAISAMRYADVKNHQAAREWAAKIKAPGYAFDRLVLSASIEVESGNWQKATEHVKAAQNLPEQQGNFFTDEDLLRVQLFTLVKHKNPRQAMQEINALYEKVNKQKDNQEKLADVLYQRAIIYADNLNEPEKAIADLKRYRELRPDSVEGMNALGYTMLSAPGSNIEEAFQLIEAAYRLEPESAAINDSLGWAYLLKGDATTALPYLEFAFEQQPDPEVASHLGEAYWKLGRQEQAKEVFKKGLKEKEGKRSILLETMKRLGVVLPKTK